MKISALIAFLQAAQVTNGDKNVTLWVKAESRAAILEKPSRLMELHLQDVQPEDVFAHTVSYPASEQGNIALPLIWEAKI